jgi:HD-GYP domain-containing protein (c-di-GMP phosphodiesterase class II)
MGGDEFCAIVDGEGPRAEAALARAGRALSEQGDAFSITSSSGAVACPVAAASASAALGVADGRMYVEKARHSIDQVQTRDAVLKMLHERDPKLREHMREVAVIAMRVAARIGLDEPAIDQVTRAAELHDIGKIAVPDAILHKADSLDADEWRFMREYPIVGERILRSAPSLAPIAPLVRSSHERWDGLGYPDGLEHGQIPLGSRIIAVCDAYHSMRSARPYKRACSEAEALEELRRCAGTQFDPAVVRALCDEIAARASERERRRLSAAPRRRPPRGH